MKLIIEYLEQVRHFECIAAQEKNIRLKRRLERQANAYRRFAEIRAKQLDTPLPATTNATPQVEECA
jgi:hypothetical protein